MQQLHTRAKYGAILSSLTCNNGEKIQRKLGIQMGHVATKPSSPLSMKLASNCPIYVLIYFTECVSKESLDTVNGDARKP
jgi:hypothetical protein